MFWFAASVAVLLAYWSCLRFLFPGYFDPLSAFHVDFYDYVAAWQITLRDLLTRYPRPASYIGMKLLAFGGLKGLMVGGIAIALLNVLLTLALVRKALRFYAPWLLASLAVYAALLFAHPDFYIEHRHDLPAELSYLFLAISLLSWISWLAHRHRALAGASSRALDLLLLVASVLFAILFAFAKETYFVSALCIVAGLAIADRPDRWRHSGYLLLLGILECCSLAWTRRINGPFVNPNAAANSAYQMSFDPATIGNAFLFYLSHLLNPALVLIVVLAVITAWRDRRQFILAVTFLVAGLTALATHSLLPNHLFEEYAWVAAPLFLAPVLVLGSLPKGFRWRWAQVVLAGGLAVFAIAGPGGYRENYGTPNARWSVDEDRKGAAIAAGLSSFEAVPRPARVLVVGLEDTALPWESRDFVRVAFGERIFWTVALPRTIQYRRNSRLVRFADVSDVELRDFDFLAAYQASGALASIRPVASIPGSEPLSEVLVPGLSPLLAASRARPWDYGPLLQAASMAIDWGLWTEAARCLDQARQEGAADATYQRLLSELRDRPAEKAKLSQVSKLTARPAHIIQPDGSGAGIAELFWTVPDGVAFEIHVSAPNGPLFTAGEKSGHARTEKWVTNGMEFFLQDVTGGKPLIGENTLARVKVDVSRE